MDPRFTAICHDRARRVQPFSARTGRTSHDLAAGGCRAYLVVNNKSSRTYTALKLDLVMFQTDGVIGRRFALDLAPVKSGKTSVKLFDLDGVKCDEVGSLLINDIMDCKAGAGEEAGCLERLTVASRTKAQLSK